MSLAFCSVAFGDRRYIEQLHRMTASILDIYPDAALFTWEDRMPPGAIEMNKSMYGFKPYGVYEAYKHGHKKVIWFDPACVLVQKVDYWFEILPEYGVLAAQDDNLLANFCGDFAYEYFGKTRDQSREEKDHLVGGSVYVFDFTNDLSNKIFGTWLQAERDGMFGNAGQPEHRNDESCMALSLYKHNSTPTPYDVCRYNNVADPIVKKFHFK